MPSRDELKMLQALPLDIKVAKTKQRIREWVDYYGTDGVYVSFSGGKDSTVLLHIVREMYPDIEAVFVNTGLEYPEIQAFVKTFDNVTILRPKMRFDEVIRKYGYPFISKEVSKVVCYARKGKAWAINALNGLEYDGHFRENSFKARYKKYEPLLHIDFNISNYCCTIMKKQPLHNYKGKTYFVGTLAEESDLRLKSWLKTGCNAFESKVPHSSPLSFWTTQDILHYIKRHNLPIASVYGEIVSKNDNDGFQYVDTLCPCNSQLCTTKCRMTGCIFCGFSAHLDMDKRGGGESRFQRLKRTHPRQYEYCMDGGAYDADGLWKPTQSGLGMAHCIDELNKIYGKDFIRY